LGGAPLYGLMSEQEIAAVWRTALDRFNEAERVLREWDVRNPYPAAREEDEDAWEMGHETVARPYNEAMKALEKFPAPDLQAVILKLGLLRIYLDGQDNEDELKPRLDSIARDLGRLAIPC
jgi:hypothetical protein